MPKFNVTRRYAWSADQVFAIARDVASYHLFLPLVLRSDIFNYACQDGKEAFDAVLKIAHAKLGIGETAVAHMDVDPDLRQVTARSRDGSIKSMHSVVTLRPTGAQSCEITFEMNLTLKSRTLQFMISGMFDMFVRKILSAFEERAKELYPRSVIPAKAGTHLSA